MTQKMGTHYVREICQLFRETAADCGYPSLKEKLETLADDLEPLATKLYFKTQKGNEEMEALAGELSDLKAKMAVCDEAGAQSFCTPYFAQLEKTMKHVKTMKVRMT
ncbi:MAG: hypothetical protein P1P84_15920 [Deferrisomatales bacterium]|nr:hypothetical protein [Deferrisomatales bacterium]